MMMVNITTINWSEVGQGVPAFLTIALMPLTYSISYGVIGGILSYIFINGAVFLINFVQLKIWPNSAPAELKSEGTWRIARAMTFTVPKGNSDHVTMSSELDHSTGGLPTTKAVDEESKA